MKSKNFLVSTCSSWYLWVGFSVNNFISTQTSKIILKSSSDNLAKLNIAIKKVSVFIPMLVVHVDNVYPKSDAQPPVAHVMQHNDNDNEYKSEEADYPNDSCTFLSAVS